MTSVDEAQAGNGYEAAYLSPGLAWTIFVLSLVGVGLSAYLFYAHLNSPAVLACPENATVNCAKVTTSPQSYFLGMPVSLLGLVFYLVFAVVNFPRLAAGRALGLVRLVMAVGAMIFVLWLVYAELLLVGAICLYCTGVHLVTLAIFLLVVYASVQGGLFSRRSS